jgi:hypothetical protein
LKLEIQSPGEFYRGSRFDWSGCITQVVLAGKHSFCGTESTDEQKLNTLGRGFYNEFGISSAIAYDDCKPGEYFHKIGTGLLRKQDNAPYSFFKTYEIENILIQSEISAKQVQFTIESPMIRGYSYFLRKTISLDGSEFLIEYELRNTGKLAFSTNEYVHNFLCINGRSIDSSYVLSFPFKIDPDNFIETVNPDSNVFFGDNSVNWKKEVNPTFFFARLNNDKSESCGWKLVHKEEKAGISEECSSVVSHVNLWGEKHVVSPELFHPISLLPGACDIWKRKYSLFEI